MTAEALASGLIFNHDAGQNKPWVWAVIHASAVLAASAGVVIFWNAATYLSRT